MTERNLPISGQSDGGAGTPNLLDKTNVATETIDLDGLLNLELSSTGSFDFSGQRKTSFIKLLEALPICALLIDRSHKIVFPNACCGSVSHSYGNITGTAFESLFPHADDAIQAETSLERVFLHRKPAVLEAVLAIGASRIWGRLHLRSLRIGKERCALLLIQDLTIEKKQLLLNKRHEQALRAARDELEKRVQDRTLELNLTNEKLRTEIMERKRAQAALQNANLDLERRVEQRTKQLVETNGQLRLEIEQRRHAETKLRKTKETMEALFSATSDIVFLVDATGTLLALNKSFSETSDNRGDQLLGKNIHDLFGINEAVELQKNLMEVIVSGEAVRCEESLENRVFDCSLYPVLGAEGQVERVAAFCRDVTQSKQAEARLNLVAKIIKSSNEGILVTDVRGDIVEVNEAFCRLTGYTRDEVIGKNPRIMKSDRHSPAFYGEMWKNLRETGHWMGEVWDRRKDGEVFPKLLSISSVRNDADQVTYYVGIFSDITQIKQTEQRLRRLAHFDPLTRLPNRLLFRDRLQQALVEAGQHGQMVALMLLDLDRFKNINDSLGHKAGDDLLKAVAKRIVSCVRKSDTVARLGGDEFTVVLSEIPEPQIAAGVARKIMRALAEPFRLGGREVFITASVGISLYPSDSTEVGRLLQSADMALYRAKDQGRDNFQFFAREMNLEVAKRLDLELALRGAVERNEFTVYYQPRLNCSTGQITGVEALVRWNHPTRGLVSPLDFIPAAEETGLIVPIGEWVTKAACAQKKAWQQAGLPSVTMAVNASARQLAQPDLVDTIVRIIRKADVDPTAIELELTESVAMKDADTTIKIFSEFKRNGIQICIDDFGTGYSSLNYLKRFPIDKLKIDKSFVEFCSSEPDDKAIVEAIIAVAHSLKLTVVAEGVETEEQLGLLKGLNCDEWQGYYCSRPVPGHEMAVLLGK